MPSGEGKPLDRSIVEGPLAPAVWMLAWPTMLQNLIGGLQGVVDHAVVGHFVGDAGNAAIGVAIRLFNVVAAFVMSWFRGMGGLVAPFGAGAPSSRGRSPGASWRSSGAAGPCPEGEPAAPPSAPRWRASS